MFTITDKRAATRVREYIYSWWLLEWSSVVGEKERCCATDPYRPPVGTTPLNDAPFVVKGSEKLPTENVGLDYVGPGGQHERAGSHE